MQHPSSPGGNLQDGRTAQAPVRDQDRAALAQLGGGNGHFRQDRHAGQSPQPRRLDLEGEQRRHRRRQRVTELHSQMSPGRRAAAARGQQQPLAIQRLAADAGSSGDTQIKSSRRGFLRGRNRAIRPQCHSAAARGIHQGIHDGLGGIGGREHPAVRLGFQLHAARFKPGHRVASRELRQRPQQRPAAARIARGKFAGLETGMGDIATAAAGNAHLLEKPGGFLQHGHRRAVRRRRDGRKESRRAAPDHDDFA